MWRNIQRMKRMHGKHFDIAPTTYVFPEDYKKFNVDREVSNFKNMYIMKPIASSCGRGIRVIGKKQSVKKYNNYIVSKYVSKPHLIRGYKYDLRLYILVTGFEPLKIYMFQEGLVRLATVPYSTSKTSLKQRFVHLTNFSVNKKSEAYVKNVGTDTTQQSAVESKLSLTQLRQEYEKIGINYEEVMERVKDVCIKTILASENPIVNCMGATRNKNGCFEVFGFDVIIDSSFKPWILEVNVCPSLSSSSPMDKYVKTLLLSDCFYLLGIKPFDRKLLEK